MMAKKQKIIIITTLVACILVINYLLLGLLPYSKNDLSLKWLVKGKKYFTSFYNDEEKEKLIYRTNAELIALGNAPDFFYKDKEKGLFRIFCVGGSTTQGWPFNPYFSYPKLMHFYLNDLLPNNKTEVINAGVMGSNSFSDIELVKEISKFQPDLLILYEGRNEIWDYYLYRSKRSSLLKFHVLLTETISLYRFARFIIWKLKGSIFDHAEVFRRWLEEIDPVINEVRLKKDILDNLSKIKNITDEVNCDLVITTQIRFENEVSGSPMDKINNWLRDWAKEESVHLIDLDEHFQKDDLKGHLLDISLHPDFTGYIQMADIVIRYISSKGIIPDVGRYQWGRIKPISHYLKIMNIAPVHILRGYVFFKDTLFGPIGNEELKSRTRRVRQLFKEN